jgi:hypothetical protein
VHAMQTPRRMTHPTISAKSWGADQNSHSKRYRHNLVHLSDELVDVGFSVAEIATLDVVLEFACPPATSGVGELEGP